MHWSKLNRDVDIPKLDCDVDSDELDFEVLPWLTNFSELEIKEDPDRDHAMSAISAIVYSKETNNNDCENGDKLWVEANQRKKQFQCDVCLKNLSTKFGLKINKRAHLEKTHILVNYVEKDLPRVQISIYTKEFIPKKNHMAVIFVRNDTFIQAV